MTVVVDSRNNFQVVAEDWYTEVMKDETNALNGTAVTGNAIMYQKVQ